MADWKNLWKAERLVLMKKTYKVFIIIASCCLVVGVFLLSIGLAFGGTRCVVFGKNGIETKEKKDYYYESNHVQGIENLDISLNNAAVEFCKSDDDTFYVIVDMKNVYDEPEVVIENDEITIKDSDDSFGILVNFDIFNSNKHVVTVYIPENKKLNEIVVDTDNGMISSDVSFSVKTLMYHSDNAAISIEKMTCTDKADIESCNGAVKLSGDFIGETRVDVNNGAIKLLGKYSDSLNVKADNGKILLDGELTGKSVFKASNGAIELNVSGKKKDYDISAKSDNGSVRIDGERISREYVQGADTGNSINAKTNNGSVTINFD